MRYTGSVDHPELTLSLKARDPVFPKLVFVFHFPSILINNPNPDTMINDCVLPPYYSKFTREGSAPKEARPTPIHFHSCSSDEFKTMSMSKFKKSEENKSRREGKGTDRRRKTGSGCGGEQEESKASMCK